MVHRSVTRLLGRVAVMTVGAAIVVGLTAGAAAVSSIGDRQDLPPRAQLDRAADGSLRLVVTGGDARGADLARLAEGLGASSAVEVVSEQALVMRVPIVVRRGATLRLENFDLRLASGGGSPADVVADGGTVEIVGGRVTGWDREHSTIDRSIDDGRAHLRARGSGARLAVDDVVLSHLGDERSGAALVWVEGAEGSFTGSRVLDSERGVRVDGAAADVDDAVIARTRREGLLFERCRGEIEVTGNRILQTGSRGIKLARGCGGARVEGNDVTGAGEDGIELLRAGPRIEVQDNRVHGNARVGITVTESRGVEVSTNRVFGNERGIVVRHRSREVQVDDNLLVGNRRDGVHLDDAGSARMSGNQVRDNAGPGIRIEDGAGGRVGPGNVVVGNLDGLRVDDNVATLEVVDNEIRANAKDGIHLGRVVRLLTLSGNEIARNGQAAFSVTVEGVTRALREGNFIDDHPHGMERLRDDS